jgi:cyclic beta-1,2-glucan synthetase
VARQMCYAALRGVPWGISESCFQSDGDSIYQYRAFGVPGLGMAPDLDEDLVVAPYAAALALLLAPREACANLAQLEQLGCLSPWGFYDAIDYTPARRPSTLEPCRTVMAHHSGMSLLAMAAAVLGNRMQMRFMQVPLCRAHDFLLQERPAQAVRPMPREKLDGHAAWAEVEHRPLARLKRRETMEA